MQSPEHEGRALAEVVERLVDRFPDLPEDRIRAVVASTHREFEGHRIRDFVPILVERHARAQLKDNPTA